jgi:hypothetical protein
MSFGAKPSPVIGAVDLTDFGSSCKVTSPAILAPWFALGVLALGFC